MGLQRFADGVEDGGCGGAADHLHCLKRRWRQLSRASKGGLLGDGQGFDLGEDAVEGGIESQDALEQRSYNFV